MTLEGVLEHVAQWFLSPVLLGLTVMCCYTLFALFSFILEATSRVLSLDIPCALTHEVQRNPDVSLETLELVMLTELEGLRIVSRLAPLLGVIAAMLAVAPSLSELNLVDARVPGESLLLALAAMTGALLAGGITWGVLQVRTRWLLTELNAFLDCSAAPAMPRISLTAAAGIDGTRMAGLVASTLPSVQNRMFKLL